MLVLTRKRGEGVHLMLGKQKVRVSVERIDGGKVRLGFEAALDVLIVREELLDGRQGDAREAR